MQQYSCIVFVILFCVEGKYSILVIGIPKKPEQHIKLLIDFAFIVVHKELKRREWGSQK